MTDQPQSKRRWYQFSLLTLLLVTTFAGIGFAWLRYKMKDAEIDKLRKEKVAVAEKWLNSTSAGKRGEFNRWEFADSFSAARAVKDSRLELASNKQERLTALREYRELMNRLYKKTHALYVAGAQGGESHCNFEAEFHFLEAQIWVMEEENWP